MRHCTLRLGERKTGPSVHRLPSVGGWRTGRHPESTL